MTAVHKRAKASRARIDQELPHQVALQDDLCVGRNYGLIASFCEENGLDCETRPITMRFSDGKCDHYRLHCFATPEAASLFMRTFGGELFNPRTDRGRGPLKNSWTRDFPWRRFVDSGPLRVPDDLIR